ncbi:MAG: hypothetical protein GF317_03000 [Candidatus Lokiarchaeota archaeon]|nr:hypothetical protein [Candidatus Lokiarchaeota archaeon]MBD3198874.1 hypothetical protein [Candidatus Lokiarchaeota archaeon]
MGKGKKSKLGIKTSRYFTKTCSNCGYEYPNWFVSCPNCGITWDSEKQKSVQEEKDIIKKNIKIVAKLTEEDFSDPLELVNLVFSGDKGKTWYKMKMDYQSDYYLAEIVEVPEGARIIYYIEVVLEQGEKIIENNEGKYFLYQVGSSMTQEAIEPTKNEEEQIQENVEKYPKEPEQYFRPNENEDPNLPSTTSSSPAPSSENLSQETSQPKIPQEYVEFDDKSPNEVKFETETIFGKPQHEKDPDLKVCPHCNSQIKKMWSTCPICGKKC